MSNNNRNEIRYSIDATRAGLRDAEGLKAFYFRELSEEFQEQLWETWEVPDYLGSGEIRDLRRAYLDALEEGMDSYHLDCIEGVDYFARPTKHLDLLGIAYHGRGDWAVRTNGDWTAVDVVFAAAAVKALAGINK